MMSDVRAAVEILALVIAVAVVAGATRRAGVSPPLVLVVVGVVASLIPGVPDYRLDPEVVLVGLLPPLLYAAALRTSLVDVRANRQAIGILAVGAVVFTTVVVGVIAWSILPSVSLAAGLALGAVVAPPDAVAATTIGRRVGMPRRLVSILEGESLLNDATALVSLRSAAAAITATVGFWAVLGDFALAVIGGLAVGIAVAAVLAAIRKNVTDPVLDTTLSFIAPFLAYLPAEAFHASGVLAVVVAGLLLIGLQIPDVVRNALDSNVGNGRILLLCVAVFLATVVSRVVWVFAATAVYRFGPEPLRRNAWPWSHATLVSWAGMRGVVTLAAAFVLPAETPARDALVLAAIVVVAGSLLLQGTTLPLLSRRLALPGPDAAEDALQEAALLSNATKAGLSRLEELRSEGDDPAVIDRLEERIRSRSDAAWERLGRGSTSGETPSESYRRLRTEMLRAERAVVLEARDSGHIDDEVLRDVLSVLDVEESLLDRLGDKDFDVERELVSRTDDDQLCEHLADAPVAVRPSTPDGCEECLRDDTRWVHLRLCLTCGHVGCCDSSTERHATAHAKETDHPAIRSFEPGESWRWCYVDEQLG
jgi:NhaP-type Na+/H+ or K+/H+ antiporter